MELGLMRGRQTEALTGLQELGLAWEAVLGQLVVQCP